MLIFAHIEKTAGTSLKYIFRNNFGLKHCDSLKNKKKIFTQDDLNFAKKVFGNIKCITGHNLVEPTKNLQDDDLMFLTFLRDPILRTASFYQDFCVRRDLKTSFEDWIKDERKHNMQTRMIAGGEDLEKAKKLLSDKYFFVGLTEQFNDSLKLLSVVSPEKLHMKYMKKLIAQDNSIKNSLVNNPKTLQILEEVNKLDLELYDYVKNDLFPKRMQQYQNEIDQVKLPESHYKSHFTFKYQLSVGFNKYIYRQLLKIKKP